MASEVPAILPEAPESQASTVEPNSGVQEPVQLPQTESGVDAPKPARAAPKVFASPKKKNGKQAHGNQAGPKQSLRSKLRKALAPYLTSTYLKGEMAKRFTQDFIDTHPLPDKEDDMPAYVQLHMHELNRVTARWTDTVGKALDPDLHRLAVEDRLKRIREQEEGRFERKDAASGRQAPHGPHPPRAGEDPTSPRVDAGYGEADVGLSSEQLFGAVQLVSDVQVWQQILAAQRAEEKRQHAIAELHLHHAARIIQRSWHSFMAHKKEEQARLDALVSPDVQAMLSAAAYKAMRDARTRLTIQKLRKSLSRKARGFGSTLPRDLEPISRPSLSSRGQPSRGPMERRSRTGLPARGSNMSGIGATGDDWDGDEADGDMRGATSTGDGTGDEGARRTGRGVSFRTEPAAVAKAQSFAFRSAQIVQRMVSIKEVDRGQDGPGYLWSAFGSAASGGTDGEDESSEDDDTEDDDDDEDDEDEEEEEEEEEEEVGKALEPESAEAAIAEAEEVVAVAAELARSFMRRDSGTAAAGSNATILTMGGDVDGGGEEESDYEDDEDGRVELDEEALQLLNSVEAAAAAAASGRPYTPPPEALAAAATAGPRPPARGTDGGPYDHPSPRPPRASGPSDTSPSASLENALLRQIIAGAFAAAAAPVLGRNNAMAMAELSLSNTTLEATGGLETAAAAVAAAAAETAAGLGVPLGFPSRPRRKTGQLRPKPLAAGRIRDLGEAQVTAPIGDGPRRTVAVMGTGQAQPGPLEIRSSATMAAIAAGVGNMGVAGATAAQAVRVRVVEGNAEGSDGKASERMMPPPWAQARSSEPGVVGAAAAGGAGQQDRSDSGGALSSPPGRRMPRTSYGGGTTFLPYVVPPPAHATTNSGEAAADAACADGGSGGGGTGSGGGGTGSGLSDGGGSGHGTAGGGHSAGGGLYGGSADTNGGSLLLPLASPRMSSTIISAAAAAAAATQPWATRRSHYHPPGSHTIAGALPDPRVGAPKDTAVREPSWLLPPIPSAVSRAATGPPCLGGHGSGGVSHSAAISPTGAAVVLAPMARTSSDPNLPRPPGIGGGVAATGPRLTIQVAPQEHQQQLHHSEASRSSLVHKLPTTGGVVVSPRFAAAMGPTAGRARRASVVGSSMAELQQYGYAAIAGGGMMPGVLSQSVDGSFTAGHVQCGFHVNGLHGGVAVSTTRLRPTRLTSEGGQTAPLPSALTGGGGGAGGGTAAARQVKHHMAYTRGL